MRRVFLFPRYQRDVSTLLNQEEQDEMERHIADDPERHPLIVGGSGMRKGTLETPWHRQKWRLSSYLLLRASGCGLFHCNLC